MLELLPSTMHRGLQESVPLLLAANGELIAERAGLVNIGIEGVMLCGALAAAAAGWWSGSAETAIAAAVTTGAAIGLLFAAWTVWLARDQIVTGLALNLLAMGLTGVLLERLNHTAAEAGGAFTSPRLAGATGADGLAITTLFIVVATHLALRYSRAGLTLRAVGENAEAADAAGVRVLAVRTAAATAGCCLAALAGAYLTLVLSDRFQENMTAGRGYVALALVIFGRWSAPRIALAALFFGMLDALQVTLQPYLGARIHVLYPLMLALPYLLTLAALAGFGTRVHPPAGLGAGYRRG